MDFKDQVKMKFHYLFKEGFQLLDSEERREGLVLIAEGDQLRIKFVNDRADFAMSIATIEKPLLWKDFYEVMDYLREQKVLSVDYKYSNKIGVTAVFMKKALPAIKANSGLIEKAR